MAITLSKGGTVSLTKEAGPRGLTALSVGLGWDPDGSGVAYDLDASALVLDARRRVLADDYFVFYNNLQSPERALVHSGDARDGVGEGPEGDGDDERIAIDLPLLPSGAESIVFVVSIHDPESSGRSFGRVRNAHIRVLNHDGGAELARFDLSNGASTESAMVFGEVYRDGSEWKFRAIGDGHAGGFVALLRSFGVGV